MRADTSVKILDYGVGNTHTVCIERLDIIRRMCKWLTKSEISIQ